MKKVNISRDTIIELAFLCFVFLLYTLWAILVPFGECPDEPFRYKIPDYIYQFWKLPKGDDPYIMDAAWGLSYGFTPILSYMFSGALMKLVSFFTTDLSMLQLAARMVSVLFSTGTVFLAIRIGKRIFKGIYSWIFVILIALLPQFIFISSYVNCDAICLFSTAWIIYAIIWGNDRIWDIKSCLFLGSGIGICLLSYYNAYGVILMAAVFCLLSVISDSKIDKKFSFIASRVGLVFLTVFIVAGWWFIRSYIIYDGDLLGLTASRECAEIYAMEELKPHNRSTPQKLGYSLKYMLIDMQWITLSIKSFIGRFGWFTIPLRSISYYFVGCLVLFGFSGNIIHTKVKEIYVVKQKLLFNLSLIGMMILTIAISVYYSYCNDFQPQGRYCLPAWLPLAILVTAGIGGLVRLLPKKVQPVVLAVLCIGFVWIALDSTFTTILQAYY